MAQALLLFVLSVFARVLNILSNDAVEKRWRPKGLPQKSMMEVLVDEGYTAAQVEPFQKFGFDASMASFCLRNGVSADDAAKRRACQN